MQSRLEIALELVLRNVILNSETLMPLHCEGNLQQESQSTVATDLKQGMFPSHSPGLEGERNIH